MIKFRLPILLTAVVAVFVIATADVALSVLPGTECPDTGSQGPPNWSCRGINVYGPTNSVPVACDDDPINGCRVYTWNIEVTEGANPSHLNLIIASDIANNIVAVYNNDPEVPLEWSALCDGRGDPSTEDFPFGRYLQWDCTVKISTDSEPITQVNMKVRGESGLVNMDSSVKRGSDTSQFGWGITTGPGTVCKTKSDYPITSRGNIDDIAGVRIKINRNEDGCGTEILYCPEPDPINPDVCPSGWEAPEKVDAALIGQLPIIHCSDDRDPTTSLCNECSFVTQVNPGWIWYKIAGEWYKICGDYYNPIDGVCCDTVTQVCCFSDGRCCDYKTDPPSCNY